tara:strand:+ start:3365 stop:4699 length:1335 start_codon:yes stop_codon:yes gene_type:complete
MFNKLIKNIKQKLNKIRVEQRPIITNTECRQFNNNDVIIIIGYRNIGKTYLCNIIENELNIKHYDLDELIKKKTGNIKDYIKYNNWEKFREMENKLFKELLKENLENSIISLGGFVDTVENQDILEKFQNIIWLRCYETQDIIRVNNNNKKPCPNKNIKEEYNKRKIIYNKISKYEFWIENFNALYSDNTKNEFIKYIKTFKKKMVKTNINTYLVTLNNYKNTDYYNNILNKMNEINNITSIELRCDLMINIRRLPFIINKIRQNSNKDIILVLKDEADKGLYSPEKTLTNGRDTKYYIYKWLLKLNIEYLEIESRFSELYINKLNKYKNKTKFIGAKYITNIEALTISNIKKHLNEINKKNIDIIKLIYTFEIDVHLLNYSISAYIKETNTNKVIISYSTHKNSIITRFFNSCLTPLTKTTTNNNYILEINKIIEIKKELNII